MKAWRGLHMRADGHSRQSDYECIRLAGLDAAKIMTNTDIPTDMARLKEVGISPEKVLLRLFESTQGRPVGEFSPENFCDWNWRNIDQFLEMGGRYVEVHNEPNLPQEGLGTQWANATEFSSWFLRVHSLLRARYAGRVLIGFPGLSPQPNVPQWLFDCLPAFRASDWIGAHAYWQNPQDWSNPNEGLYFQRFVGLGKPVMITEFSNKFSLLSPFDKGRAYALYYDAVPVLAAFCFVSSASNPEFQWGDNIHQSGEVWVTETGHITEIPNGIRAWQAPVPPPPPPPANESGVVIAVDAIGGWDTDLANWLRANHPKVRYGSTKPS